MDSTGTINGVSARFYEIGEPYAGGFYERPEKGSSYRYAKGMAAVSGAFPYAGWYCKRG
jgi:hypothetical protein